MRLREALIDLTAGGEIWHNTWRHSVSVLSRNGNIYYKTNTSEEKIDSENLKALLVFEEGWHSKQIKQETEPEAEEKEDLTKWPYNSLSNMIKHCRQGALIRRVGSTSYRYIYYNEGSGTFKFNSGVAFYPQAEDVDAVFEIYDNAKYDRMIKKGKIEVEIENTKKSVERLTKQLSDRKEKLESLKKELSELEKEEAAN